MREAVMIPGPPVLEGVYESPESVIRGSAVIAHPHSLRGGTMAQPVVHHVAKACRRMGLATVRFNFRGVGLSQGEFSGMDEWEDVRAAADMVTQRAAVDGPMVLAGYSFGARMSALAALKDVRADALILVAFPMLWEDLTPNAFDRLGEFTGPVLSVCGRQDDIAPPAEVEAFFYQRGLQPETVVISGTDHFFHGRHGPLEAAVESFLLRCLPTEEASGERKV